MHAVPKIEPSATPAAPGPGWTTPPTQRARHTAPAHRTTTHARPHPRATIPPAHRARPAHTQHLARITTTIAPPCTAHAHHRTPGNEPAGHPRDHTHEPAALPPATARRPGTRGHARLGPVCRNEGRTPVSAQMCGTRGSRPSRSSVPERGAHARLVPDVRNEGLTPVSSRVYQKRRAAMPG